MPTLWWTACLIRASLMDYGLPGLSTPPLIAAVTPIMSAMFKKLNRTPPIVPQKK